MVLFEKAVTRKSDFEVLCGYFVYRRGNISNHRGEKRYAFNKYRMPTERMHFK